MEQSLYEELIRYSRTDSYPFHMPGHKRRLGGFADPFSFDITEIEGFDNLHHAEGILLKAQQRAADFFGAEETHFLVNGSTSGILSAIGACVPSGKLLMTRNSHKAAYHSLFLNRLEAVYLYSEDGREETERILERESQIRAVYLTAPIYEGILPDVKGILEAAHSFGLPVIVDEAHGAHFGMHPVFPPSAVSLGADLVIQSVHKTLPSLTQTALLHVNGSLVDRRRLGQMLGIYQSSSPSYVLMASIDRCVGLLKEQGAAMFDAFARELTAFYHRMEGLGQLCLLKNQDPSKILICGRKAGLTGRDISRFLRQEYSLELEMETRDYALALASVGDSPEGFRRLGDGLLDLDGRLETGTYQEKGENNHRSFPAASDEGCGKNRMAPEGKRTEEKRPEGKILEGKSLDERFKHSSGPEEPGASFVLKNEAPMTIWEAEQSPKSQVALETSQGRICGEYLYLYPPGVPLAVPGERISRELLEKVLWYRDRKWYLQGLEDPEMEKIWVVDREEAWKREEP